MTDGHQIVWADTLWDPLRGCSRKSAACINCYAEATTAANAQAGGWGEGFAALKNGVMAWTGEVALREDRFALPFEIGKPSRILVNSMSDLFHDDLAETAIDRVFAVMALLPQHQFLVLTKRQKKMQAYMADPALRDRIARGIAAQGHGGAVPDWPLPNVWLGVTAENQKEAERRIPVLLETPAALRFIAAEPLLGPLSLDADWLLRNGRAKPVLDWVMAGGESGPKSRPIELEWVRDLRDQCARLGTPFFWNDWGASMPDDQACKNAPAALERRYIDGELHDAFPARVAATETSAQS